MKKEIKDLFNKEEWMGLTLHNCNYLLSQYCKMLEDHVARYGPSQESDTYASIFGYYQNDLIPALVEMVMLGEKHVASLVLKNPERQDFMPIRSEVLGHQEIVNNFYKRFENLHKGFYAFIKRKNGGLNNEINNDEPNTITRRNFSQT